jgi:Tol biopolymer transport system component
MYYPQITADGSRVFYRKAAGPLYDLYAVSTAGGEPERVCQDCGTPSGWTRDGKNLLSETGRTKTAYQTVVLVDAATGAKSVILKHPKHGISRGRLSPDDRWIAFHSILPAARQIFVAPFHGAAAIPEDQWVSITDGKAMDRYAEWSPDGNLLYFLSDRDGFRCIWAQRLDPKTKHPLGEAFPVQHFHTSRRSLLTIEDPIGVGLSVTADKIVFSMVEQTGNIWLKDLP